MGLNDVFLLNTDISANTRILEVAVFQNKTSGEPVSCAFYNTVLLIAFKHKS
ncbi:hypothetical protein GPAL_3257 [Glaciecola pallidula DSM 14239 = ACAM 615]|uniref:Uncharacterized protein n=1 Tax=Brumicola pallidula DSM 14239 = ACAM 615 TaxID=1121922 RepID=K6ZMJ8_9ALTE|nr:hypothetical protein GPAL_3257 [Glaciecola pallidula DSM 14239 = ACAM 615]